ncbi:cell surface protein, gy family [Levilactobacillus paucivorans]|uniref:Cell surface protein, gy family n=1 Tax=Levilactobacillus paucivorans TaxID=616990 RepID=A0A0R2LZ73_9LACO|nr:MucBP domain-containing protein [Levilactobacillus paucivorans]KRO03955.1 cell surface protein, gy family [Levilactobacillus paucivorans]
MSQHLGEIKTHYKSYKAGKHWVYASIVVVAFGLGMVAAPSAHAATTVDPTDKTEVVTSEATKEQSVAKLGATEEQTPSSVDHESITPKKVTTPEKTTTPTPTVKTTEDPKPVTPAPDNSGVKVDTEKTEKAPTPKPAVRPQSRMMATPVVGTPAADVPADTSIDSWMPNKTLQKIVLMDLQAQNKDHTWASVNDITQDDMLLLTTLQANGGPVANGMNTYIDGHTAFSLEGLQYAKNLTYLDLEGHDGVPGMMRGDIVDLSPIKDLTKLTGVNVQFNRIQDISPLENLTNLTELHLAYNSIVDFTPYSKFKKLWIYSTGGQQLILPPIALKSGEDYHMAISPSTPTGKVDLTPYTDEHYDEQASWLAGNPMSFGWRIYFTAGDATSDGNGGLNFTNIPTQKPGITVYPDADWVKIYPMDNYYYMIGQYNQGDYNLMVIQPYTTAVAAADVTVSYQDESGKTISPTTTLAQGSVGDAYTTTPLDISGYKLLTTPDNAKGVYGTDPINVIYTYKAVEKPVDPTPTPTETGTVTVISVDQSGKVLSQTTQTGTVGDSFAVTAPEISGYQVTGNSSATGTYTAAGQTVTFTYAKVTTGGGGATVNPEPEKPVKPGKPGQPSKKPTTSGGAAAKVVTAAKTPATGSHATDLVAPVQIVTAEKTLPQTNESAISPLLGLLLLVGSSVTGLFFRRKRN